MSNIDAYRKLQKTAKELNQKFDLGFKIPTTQENYITHIVEVVGNLSEEQKDTLTPEALEVYNSLLVAPPSSAIEKDPDADKKEACPSYGSGYEGADPECQACIEGVTCQEKCLESVAEKMKTVEREPSSKKEPTPKVEVAKSRYGHKVGTQGQIMDDLFWKGSTYEEIIEALTSQLNIGEDQADKALKRHAAWLKSKKKIPVLKVDNIYKSDIEHI